MRIWSGYNSAEEAVRTIKACMDSFGSLPEVLIKGYNKTITKSYRGVVQRFYELLAKECPKALKYFSNPEQYEDEE